MKPGQGRTPSACPSRRRGSDMMFCPNCMNPLVENDCPVCWQKAVEKACRNSPDDFHGFAIEREAEKYYQAMMEPPEGGE